MRIPGRTSGFDELCLFSLALSHNPHRSSLRYRRRCRLRFFYKTSTIIYSNNITEEASSSLLTLQQNSEEQSSGDLPLWTLFVFFEYPIEERICTERFKYHMTDVLNNTQSHVATPVLRLSVSPVGIPIISQANLYPRVLVLAALLQAVSADILGNRPTGIAGLALTN